MPWNTAASPVVLPEGDVHFRPLTLSVDPGTGNVQVQFEDAAGAWFTPTDAEYTVATKGVQRIDRANTPPMRILATGDAQFMVTGN